MTKIPEKSISPSFISISRKCSLPPFRVYIDIYILRFDVRLIISNLSLSCIYSHHLTHQSLVILWNRHDFTETMKMGIHATRLNSKEMCVYSSYPLGISCVCTVLSLLFPWLMVISWVVNSKGNRFTSWFWISLEAVYMCRWIKIRNWAML